MLSLTKYFYTFSQYVYFLYFFSITTVYIIITPILSTIIPPIERIIHGEFCPVNIGNPNKINTIPYPINSFPTALLYFFTSVTLVLSALAQKPTYFLEKNAPHPRPMIKIPMMFQMMNLIMFLIIVVSSLQTLFF